MQDYILIDDSGFTEGALAKALAETPPLIATNSGGTMHDYKNDPGNEATSTAAVLDGNYRPIERAALPRKKNWMRNQPCPCGSKRKFKKCCWGKFK